MNPDVLSRTPEAAPLSDAADQPAALARWQFSLRDLLVTTTVIALYLAAYAVAFRHLSAEPRRFVYALPGVFGAFVGIAVNMLFALRRGPTLHRLRMKRSRFELAWLCAMPLATMLLVVLADRWLGSKISDALLVGILAGITIGALFFVLNTTAPYVCLSATGVAVGRLAFIRWHWVHSARWRPDHELEIKLHHGLTTWRGIASPEAHAEIDAFLREKLGERLQPAED